jgi:hypothetical protein
LHNNDPVAFPSGHRGTSVGTLVTRVLHPITSVPELYLHCSQCDHNTLISNENKVHRMIYISSNATGSTPQVLDNHMHHHSEIICFNCNTPFPSKTHFSRTPKILAFDLTDRNVTLSTKVSVMGVTCSTVLYLRSLIYYGDFHFTCRIIDISGNIWFHDGMTTGNTSINDGKIGHVSQHNLHKCRNKKICLAIYAQSSS